MPTPDNIAHAMANRSRKKLIEAAVLSGGIYTYLAANNRVEFEDGGPEIENPLIVGSNPNVVTATYYDNVPVDETSELDTVLYTMSRMVATMIMSDQEIDENAGDAKIVDIMKAKMMALETAIKKKQRTNAASLTSGGDANGLPNLLPTDPTTGTIGGMNLAAEVLFRPSAYNFAGGLDETNIEEAIDDILLDLTTDDESPNVIFLGRNLFRLHRAAAREKAQISLGETGFGKKLINLGIKGTTHQGIPCIYDEMLNADHGFVLNDEHIKMHILKAANMKVKKLVAPWSQDAIGRRFIFEHQLCAWKQYRTNARFYN